MLKTKCRTLFDTLLNWWWDFKCDQTYWKYRYYLKDGEFKLRLNLFRIGQQTDQVRATTADMWFIVRQATTSFLIAIALAITTIGGETFFRRNTPRTHEFFVNYTDAILRFFDSHFSNSVENYANLIGGVASVAGVFLGLYFTAVSIGVGQQIGAISPRVRHLIVTERRGSLYINLITTFTAYSFLLWLDVAVFGSISYPGIFVLLLFILLAIASFYPLGLHSFFMADPSAIAVPIFQSIRKNLKRLERRSKISQHQSFDRHYREKTLNDFELLREVITLSLSPRRDHKQINSLLGNLYRQSLYYLRFKFSLEPSSEWYVPKLKYDDWLLPSDTSANILERFGHVQASQEPDLEWFENQILDITNLVIESYKKDKNIEEFLDVLPVLRYYIQSLSVARHINHAIAIHDIVSSFSELVENDLTIDFRNRFLLAEMAAIIKIDIIQQCLQPILKADTKREVNLLADVALSRRTKNIPSTLPIAAQQSLNISKQIKAELYIEGKIVTPRWFVAQTIAQAYAAGINALFIRLSKIHVDPKLKQKIKTFDEAAIFIIKHQRSIEFARRLLGHADHYTKVLEDLTSFQKISSPGLNIEPLETKETGKNLETILNESLDSIGDTLIAAFQENRDSSLPDVFGLAYFQLTNDLFKQLKSRELERFSKLYPQVLSAAFHARERLLNENATTGKINQFRLSSEPILDLMALGGYAALFSEIHNDQKFFTCVVSAWKDVLGKNEDNMHQWLVEMFKFIKTEFSYIKRAFIRFEWNREFSEILLQRGLISDYTESSRPAKSPPVTPWLKEFCRHSFRDQELISELFLTVSLPRLGANEKTINNLNSDFFKSSYCGDDDEATF